MKLKDVKTGDYVYLKNNKEKLIYKVEAIKVRKDGIPGLSHVASKNLVEELMVSRGDETRIYGFLDGEMDVELADVDEKQPCECCGKV